MVESNIFQEFFVVSFVVNLFLFDKVHDKDCDKGIPGVAAPLMLDPTLPTR